MDILDLTNDLHKEAIWFCFADLLQNDLDNVKEYWNSHQIRKSKHATSYRVPDMMYFLPEDFGHSDCLVPVFPHKMIQMDWFEEFDGEDDDTNPVFCEYFQYVMEKKNSLTHPTSILEAGILFEMLVKFAKGDP